MKVSRSGGMRFIGVLGVLALGLWAPNIAHAVTADNVKCTKCVGTGDLDKQAFSNKKLKKNAVKGSRVGPGAIEQKELKTKLVEKLTTGDFYVIDADGTRLGPLLDDNNALFQRPSGEYVTVLPTRNYIRSQFTDVDLYYSGPDCTGNVYVNPNEEGLFRGRIIDQGFVGPDSDTGDPAVFLPDSTSVASMVSHQSSYETFDSKEGDCNDDIDTEMLIPIDKVLDLGEFTPPFDISPAAD